MSGYVLADVKWLEEEARVRYRDMVGRTVEQFGGQFVAATTDVRVEEGDWTHDGIMVLIRFPSLERAIGWYQSEEYAPVKRVREEGSRSRLLIFEGD